MATFVLLVFLLPLLVSARVPTLFSVQMARRVSMNVNPSFPRLYYGTAPNGTLFVLNLTNVLAPPNPEYTTTPVAISGNSSITIPFQISSVKFVEPNPDTGTGHFIQLIGKDLFNPYYGKGVQVNATTNDQHYAFQYEQIELEQVPLADICLRNCFLLN